MGREIGSRTQTSQMIGEKNEHKWGNTKATQIRRLVPG